ncbi:MAG: tRNA (guanosine(46)-N7)-methyltransferase TrmB [Rhodospirillaceae bacterium]|nr:tRNA (guanosine(46)-N7)-methyltransferase TrmB [Rhodospirillaceae bacterium]
MTGRTDTPPTDGQRFFGRRHGRRLRAGRQRLVDDLLPSLAIDLPPDGAIAPDSLFARPVGDVWLEVGFGAGEHLAWQACRHPDVGFVGCEPFVNGVAGLLDQVARLGLGNVRIHPDDARALIAALAPASVGRAFVLFPDPWPKRRHHERRFICPAQLDALARCLKPGAELRLASDDPGLVDWMLMHARTHPGFRWRARRARDWRQRPDDWPQTRYELKQLKGPPVFLVFERTGDPLALAAG